MPLTNLNQVSPTDITYASLVAAIGASALIPGAQYRITDFATKHFIFDSNYAQYPNVMIKLTGSSGTANVTLAGGLTKLATWDTSLAKTASNFVAAHAAAYLAKGIVVADNHGVLIFTALVQGGTFTAPAITNATSDLAGTVLNHAADSGIITGPNEPLIVQAVSANTISHDAKSSLYPQDTIHYDWDPANWADDLGFAWGIAWQGGEQSIIAGFKGVITWRHDTLLDNYAPGDWRHCKSRRWKTAATAWNAGTAYTGVEIVYHAATTMVYRSIKAGTNQVPAGADDAYWIVMLDLTDREYWNTNPIESPNGVPSGVDYDDFTLFAPAPNSGTYELCCRANHFEGFKDNITYFDADFSLLPNDVIFLSDEDYYTCYSNKIGPEHFFNTIDSWFADNIIGSHFFSNTIGKGFSNIIGAYFRFNVIGEYADSNVVGTYFDGNIIGKQFHRNTIGTDARSNIIGFDFKWNEVASGAIDGVNLGAATHVYGDYNCYLFRRLDGAVKLRYYDNSDVAQIVAVTA